MPYRILHLSTGTKLPVEPTELGAQSAATAFLQKQLESSLRGRALLSNLKNKRVSWAYAKRFILVERIKAGWVQTRNGRIVPDMRDLSDADDCLLFVVGDNNRHLGTYDTTEEAFIDAKNFKSYDASRVSKFLIIP